MGDATALAELRDICSGARYVAEGTDQFIDLPALKIRVDADVVVRDALLSLGAHTGYMSRLYLSQQIPRRGSNWTVHGVLGRQWHTPSWNNVPLGRPVEMLLQHLKAYG